MDIWLLADQLGKENSDLKAYKVDGHPDFMDYGDDLQERCDCLGNVLADIAASVAAESSALPHWAVKEVLNVLLPLRRSSGSFNRNSLKHLPPPNSR